MTESIVVGLDERSYPIRIGENILEELGPALQDIGFARQVAVITNPTVGDLYGAAVVESLTATGIHVDVIRLPDGEEYKNLETLSHIYDVLIERNFDRHSGLVALGGGVIGDMTGYAAATYLRGIPFVQVPTTLLSQVDSSVGGKTGVNHPQGKNLIGAFYQPRHVHIDVNVLKSLSDREYNAGMAEVIKYGIIRDKAFFDWLYENRQALLDRNSPALIYAVKRSCQIKANIVENDEKEQGLRAILNLGHTFGHAVETLAGYGVIKHGEAVAIGMIMAARVARQRGLCSEAQVNSITELIETFSLPVTPPDFTASEYAAVMQRDKKVKDGVARLVLNRGIGDAVLHEVTNLKELVNGLLT